MLDTSRSELLKDVDFFVEADAFAKYSLWNRYYGTPVKEEKPFMRWENLQNFSIVIDYFRGINISFPIVLQFELSYLNDTLVAFYYCCSQISNQQIIKNFINLNYPQRRTSTNINKPTISLSINAMNFRQCYDYCMKERNKRIILEKIK